MLQGINVIYKITNLLSNKCYIGQAKDLSKRIKDHKRNVGKVKSPLYSAIRSHGWDHFSVEILYIAETYDQLDQLEVQYIEEFKSLYPYGYNLTTGGTGGDVTTNHPNKKHLYDTRKGRIPWNKGKKGVQIAWNKGSKGLVKPNSTTFQAGVNHKMYGKKQSSETIEKRRANTDYTEIFKNFPWEQKVKKCMKPVYQCDKEGLVVREWESVTTASKELGIAKYLIFQYLDKDKILNGYVWKRKK